VVLSLLADGPSGGLVEAAANNLDDCGGLLLTSFDVGAGVGMEVEAGGFSSKVEASMEKMLAELPKFPVLDVFVDSDVLFVGLPPLPDALTSPRKEKPLEPVETPLLLSSVLLVLAIPLLFGGVERVEVFLVCALLEDEIKLKTEEGCEEVGDSALVDAGEFALVLLVKNENPLDVAVFVDGDV